ncbi:alkanesulfonate monooxygenase SsuD/methylene tetrahydromethanopterin reductase-like flavin-dependent oxidoreductase (luciferase family) [Amycolatopsis lexingtonensis]|uniref:Alkanesulfonate monooxygenase SsuD/methylene tetrahydromethanopterin reductase-like flavin-dependent oxidoreductase (Luciferase family) n=1 Tax=Amycolatopsis lexingtonensis TaxID=218822 RepID=A0ABR9I8G3_9PSEU|nr:LLM class flavin-dependent oxidoreductase [Amycolatopsis lexingtonensis]MBE1499443.1 alkanesulfonate monooxygenase SsuD/methylene tetrahydromethanopterin reductase-like flavin-dependent oxidoreductase (luciferase family) [Amycolatopsis lexingtonensis]
MRVGIVILPEDRWWAAEPKWRAAEEYGFDHAWTYDHLGWRNLVDGPWFSAVPTLTAAAMVTSRIRLGTFVASPVARHPVPFTRELITLDDVSDGRFVLGVGAGVDHLHYDGAVLDAPELTAKQRVDRFTEFVEALDGLLMTDKFDFDGEYYRAREARNLPGPVQRPRLPFVVAANGPRTMTLAARFGAGWVTTGKGGATADEWWAGVKQLTEVFDQRLDAVGRDRASVQRYVNLDSSPVFSLSSVEAFRDAVGRAGELGFTDVISHWPRSSTPYEGREAVLEQVASDVLPELH